MADKTTTLKQDDARAALLADLKAHPLDEAQRDALAKSGVVNLTADQAAELDSIEAAKDGAPPAPDAPAKGKGDDAKNAPPAPDSSAKGKGDAKNGGGKQQRNKPEKDKGPKGDAPDESAPEDGDDADANQGDDPDAPDAPSPLARIAPADPPTFDAPVEPLSPQFAAYQAVATNRRDPVRLSPEADAHAEALAAQEVADDSDAMDEAKAKLRVAEQRLKDVQAELQAAVKSARARVHALQHKTAAAARARSALLALAPPPVRDERARAIQRALGVQAKVEAKERTIAGIEATLAQIDAKIARAAKAYDGNDKAAARAIENQESHRARRKNELDQERAEIEALRAEHAQWVEYRDGVTQFALDLVLHEVASNPPAAAG